ncbi:MAG: ThiF family adenylyltransferase [Nannocystaceae bacterium]
MFEVEAVVGESRHVLRLTIPPAYPRVPPEVREIGAGGTVVVPPGSRRLVDGQFCLFPHGSDPEAWSKGHRAIDALRKAEQFLELERESRRDRGWTFADGRRLQVRRSVADVVRLEGSFGTLTVGSASPGAAQAFVVQCEPRFPDLSFDTNIEAQWQIVLKYREAVPWLTLPADCPRWDQLAPSPARFLDALPSWAEGARLELVREATGVVLVRADSEPLDAIYLRRTPLDPSTMYSSKVVQGDPEDAFHARVDGVIPQRRHLAESAVVLAGLGSVGSVVATALARSGVRRFLLIDPEVLAIENLCRHVGSVTELGNPKVDVVARAIKGINPTAEVKIIRGPLAWDIPSQGAGLDLEQWLDRHPGSVVVATFAFGPIERQLNEVLIRAAVPAVYASVLGAGEHGRVFRVIPGETPCYECVLDAQRSDPDQFPRFTAEGVDLEPGVPYLQPSLPGLSIDIGHVALIAARLVLQTIARVREIDLGFPDEVGDHLLWSNRGGWGFDRPLQVRVERIPRQDDCEVCGMEASRGGGTDEQRAALESLLQSITATPGG